jgi:hypothetical protein
METSQNKIEQKLDVILKLMAYAVTEGKGFDEKIRLMTNLGFTDNQMAEVMGVKPVTVRAAKSNLKKKKK